MSQYNKSGSTILVVVLVMSTAVLWCLNTLKSFSLTMEMVLKRQEREQKYRMTEGVLRYGLWLCTNRFTTFSRLAKEGKKSFTLEVGTWNIKGLPAYKGRLNVVVRDKTIDLKAVLLTENACAFGMECQVECVVKDEKNKKKKQFFVHNWKTHV